jgi:Ca-activated chloride channel homolog
LGLRGTEVPRKPKRSVGLLLAACLSVAGGRALALDWSNVWSTREQQAQRLLDSGHPGDAARLFSDPRRRAYAELEAGHYGAAARELKPFADVDSEYNRGNALAREGELRSALASYDAALAQAPDDREVRHNRDLVARALEQRSAQKSAGSGMPQQGGAGQQDANQGSQQSGSQSSSGRDQAGERPGSPTGKQTGGSSTGEASRGADSEQAKRDAALAAELQRRRAEQGRSGSGATEARGDQSGADRSARGQVLSEQWPPPKSEQTLALEQWLRRIPEDPGGLLRRKFLIEHIERHQGADQGGDQ